MSTPLADWLARQGLGEYAERFAEEGYEDPEELRGLEESDLEKLDLKMAHRKRLLKLLETGNAAAAPAQTPPSTPAPSDTASILSSPPGRRLSVFVSYGRDHFAGEAREIADALRARGHQVWFDQRELREGYDWQLDIEEGIRQCDWLVLLMTQHSVRRPDSFCLKEITKAAELNKPIVPVLLELGPAGTPLLICNVQYLDWRDAVPAADRAEHFRQLLARLCEAIEFERLDFEGGQRTLLRHLNPGGLLDFIRDTVDRLTGFTGRKWLVDEVQRWLREPGSRVFWLTGAPGIGKSAFAAHLCQALPQVKARHFCVNNNADRSDPRKALLSIVYQLSQQLPAYAELLLATDLAEESRKDTSTIFGNLVVELLDRVPAPQEPCVVVIDAIDEASRDDAGRGRRNEIAAMIRDHWSKTPQWLRLVITSRNEVEVRSALSAFDPLEFDAESPGNRADLREYLSRELRAVGQDPDPSRIEAIILKTAVAAVQSPANAGRLWVCAVSRSSPDG